MKRDDGLLGNHLSRNVATQQYLETDAEKLLMILRVYVMKKGLPGGQALVADYVKKLGTDTTSAVGQIFNHEETMNYLLNLNDFGQLFHYHTVMTSKWIQRYLHHISGGVSHSTRLFYISLTML